MRRLQKITAAISTAVATAVLIAAVVMSRRSVQQELR